MPFMAAETLPLPSPEVVADLRDTRLADLFAASNEAAELVVSLHVAERLLAGVEVDTDEDELAERLAILGHAASALMLLNEILATYPDEA